jgi:hypothetical protein
VFLAAARMGGAADILVGYAASAAMRTGVAVEGILNDFAG